MASRTSAAPSSSGSRPTTPRPRRASSWRASSLTLTTLSAASSETRATRRECSVGAARQALPGREGWGAQEVPSVTGARHLGRARGHLRPFVLLL
eukprot:scaffold43183_cov59-Phaeocystis_antarctica.AAC.1